MTSTSACCCSSPRWRCWPRRSRRTCTSSTSTAAGRPAYFHEVLGVPLAEVGRYLRWPMLVSIFAKPVVAAAESALLRCGAGQLRLRKAAIAGSSVVAASGLLVFMRARSVAVATVAASWVMFGHCIDGQSGYLPNKMELGGEWNAHFEAYENTAAWVCMFLLSSSLAWLKRATGSWAPIWLSPIVLRALATGRAALLSLSFLHVLGVCNYDL